MFYLAKPFDLFNKQLTGFWFLFSRPPHESHEQPMAADRQWTDHFSQSLHRARLHFLWFISVSLQKHILASVY